MKEKKKKQQQKPTFIAHEMELKKKKLKRSAQTNYDKLQELDVNR